MCPGPHDRVRVMAVIRERTSLVKPGSSEEQPVHRDAHLAFADNGEGAAAAAAAVLDLPLMAVRLRLQCRRWW